MKGAQGLALGILLLRVVELPLLLPHLTGVRVVSVGATGPVVVVQARTRDESPARCTGCGITSDRVHSRYVRHLADRPIGSRAVRIGLNVRRLCCENPACPKVTFAEDPSPSSDRLRRSVGYGSPSTAKQPVSIRRNGDTPSRCGLACIPLQRHAVEGSKSGEG
ncbi:transposase family protein [Streptomyces umbrinus]|uniref:transposase family protein n=1 Tax=Streptomyces umbrinus TaxID=67370 RepID=UPI0033C2BEF2